MNKDDTALERLQLAIREPHDLQKQLIHPPRKFAMYRIGRRWGKTTGAAILALHRFRAGIGEFLNGRSGDWGRVLYAGPTSDQTNMFWSEIELASYDLVEANILRLHKTNRTLELHPRISMSGVNRLHKPNMRIKAKTAFNADNLRGDWASTLILDEYQLCNESAWDKAGEPMLTDTDGDGILLYTPPHPHSRSMSKADDKMHAAKMFKERGTDDEWFCMHTSSFDNPHLPRAGLERRRRNMSALAFRMEMMAEDVDEAPGSLWKWWMFGDEQRQPIDPDKLRRIVVGVDPSGTRTGSECGIIVAGVDLAGQGYVLADRSGGMSAAQWGAAVVNAYDEFKADRVVAEKNFGGDMVPHTIELANKESGQHREIPITMVNASRGKAIRAEPVSALYEHGKVYHVRPFQDLEQQLCMWEPQDTWSPDRLDAMVWALTDLMLDQEGGGSTAYAQPSRDQIRTARRRRRRR